MGETPLREAGVPCALLPSPVPRPPSRYPRAIDLPPRRKQCQRQNHFLGRYTAVQKGSAVTALILAQLGGINEEAIVGGEQSVATGSPPRQPQHVFVREKQRLIRTLGAEIFAELVTQIGAGVALGVNRCRRVAMNRAVIGGEEHGDLPPRCLLQDAEERRPLEPLTGYLPEGDLVAGHFIQYLRLTAAVGEQVHEVEDEGAHSLGPDCRSEMALQLVGVGGGGDLLVAHGSFAA